MKKHYPLRYPTYLVHFSKVILVLLLLSGYGMGLSAQVTITQPAGDQTVECDGNGNEEDLDNWLKANGGAMAETTPLCEGISWSNDFNGLNALCGNTGTVTVTFTATDNCNNTATTTATFSIEDTQPPVLSGTLPSGQADMDLCFDDIPEGPSEAAIAALFTDNCGDVHVEKSGTPTGDDCEWTVTYIYTITDACGNSADEVQITYSGGDTEAPTLVGQVPEGETGMTLCFDQIPVGPSEAAIAALFTDNCGDVHVEKSGTPTGDDCDWTVTYIYTIADDCGNEADPIEITYSGGDNEAPTLVGQVPEGETGMNLCFDDIPAGPSEAAIAALFTDNCGDVNVTKSGTPSGNDCSWTVTYTYIITDDCGNSADEIQITYSGGDTSAPVLSGTIPSGQADMDLCFDNIPEGHTEADIAALFTDNCGDVNVTKSGTPSGNDCSWTVTYTYIITDDCGNSADEIQITYSGGDTEAPTLVGEVPAGETGMNLCFDDIPAGPSEAAIAALFTDNCGNVNVTKSGNPSGNDCSWTVTYTYVITDDCGNSADEIQITYSGGDTSAPVLTGTIPSGQADMDLCFDDIPEGPTEADIAALFTDNCGNVNVTKSGTPSGNDCSWTVTYTYTITDDCGNSADEIQITYSGGDTEAPTLVGQVPEGETGMNLCFDDIPAGPSEAAIAALFTGNCGNVHVEKSGTPTGDDCEWAVTYIYTIVDDCGNEAEPIEITYSGGNTVAPVLSGTIPSGQADMDLCFDDIPEGPTEAEIAALFTDNCGNVNVTKSGTLSGNDCSWTATYTYTITDDCGNSADEIQITYSGGDTSAPVLSGTIPSGQADMDLCFDDIPEGPTEAAIAALFTDHCGDVNITKSGTPSGDDCSWTVTYTYVITDDCGNSADEIHITYSGGDTEAPTLVGQVPEGETGMNLCFDDIPAGPSEAAIAALFTDNCGNVHVEKSGTPTGDDCEWAVTYIYTIVDDCGNEAEPIEITYSGGNTVAPVFESIQAFDDYCSNPNLLNDMQDWLSGVSATTACGGAATVSHNFSWESIPEFGCYEIAVMFSASDLCGNLAITSSTISVSSPVDVVVSGPENYTASACGFTSQAALNNAFDLWIGMFQVVEAGCGGEATDLSGIEPPDLCKGGTVTVNYIYTDGCSSALHTATFTVTPCYITVHDGEWHDPNVWQSGCVPSHRGQLPNHSKIFIDHDVSLVDYYRQQGQNLILVEGTFRSNQNTPFLDIHVRNEATWFVMRDVHALGSMSIYIELGSTMQVGTEPPECFSDFCEDVPVDCDYEKSLFKVEGSAQGGSEDPPGVYIHEKGTFHLYGDMVVENNFDIMVAPDAHFIVEGYFTAGNNAEVSFYGEGDSGSSGYVGCDMVFTNSGTITMVGANLDIGGDLLFGNSSDIYIYGSTLNVHGEICSFEGIGSGAVITIHHGYHDENGNYHEAGPDDESYINAGHFCENFENADGVILPIELLSFSAEVLPGEVLLHWSTATEINNDFFTLERSEDAFAWEIIGQVQGAGTTSQTMHYTFSDRQPLEGLSYYRLKQTDFDGTYEYFAPLPVMYLPEMDGLDFRVVKRPDQWIIGLPGEGSYRVEVYSLNGNLLHSGTATDNFSFPAPRHTVVVRVVNDRMQAVSRVVM
jgi:hypothetical protein